MGSLLSLGGGGGGAGLLGGLLGGGGGGGGGAGLLSGLLGGGSGSGGAGLLSGLLGGGGSGGGSSGIGGLFSSLFGGGPDPTSPQSILSVIENILPFLSLLPLEQIIPGSNSKDNFLIINSLPIALGLVNSLTSFKMVRCFRSNTLGQVFFFFERRFSLLFFHQDGQCRHELESMVIINKRVQNKGLVACQFVGGRWKNIGKR